MFLVLVMNDNSDGAKYWQSRGINFLVKPGPGANIEAPWPDVVAGILAHWVRVSPSIGFTFKTDPLTHGHDSS